MAHDPALVNSVTIGMSFLPYITIPYLPLATHSQLQP